MLDKPVFLWGVSASGKSACGALLANKLEVEFVDTDVEFSKYMGSDISSLFLSQGAKFVRQQYFNFTCNFLNEYIKKKCVVAIGGTLPLNVEANGFLTAFDASHIHLVVSLESILERLFNHPEDLHRAHFLTHVPYKKEILNCLFEYREQYFLHIRSKIRTDERSISDVVTKIIDTIY